MNTLNLETQEKLLDEIGWQILYELQANARLPMSELARRVSLSAPAVAERVRRMEEAGIISGYRAEVNLEAVGLPIVAYIRLAIQTTEARNRVFDIAPSVATILECHRITGADCYLIKVAAPSMKALETVIDQVADYGQTTTSVVLSSPVSSRIIEESLLTPGRLE